MTTWAPLCRVDVSFWKPHHASATVFLHKRRGLPVAYKECGSSEEHSDNSSRLQAWHLASSFVECYLLAIFHAFLIWTYGILSFVAFPSFMALVSKHKSSVQNLQGPRWWLLTYTSMMCLSEHALLRWPSHLSRKSRSLLHSYVHLLMLLFLFLPSLCVTFSSRRHSTAAVEEPSLSHPPWLTVHFLCHAVLFSSERASKIWKIWFAFKIFLKKDIFFNMKGIFTWRRKKKQIFHSLVSSSKGDSGRGGADLKPGASSGLPCGWSQVFEPSFAAFPDELARSCIKSIRPSIVA